MIGDDPESVGIHWVPRDPEVYDTTKHFEERSKASTRVISHELAAEIIETGTLYPDDNGKLMFSKTIDGGRIIVPVVFGGRMVPLVQTGYVDDFENAERWLASERFTERSRVCERFRYLLYQESPWPKGMKRLHVTNPIPVEGHNLTTRDGCLSTKCAGCDRTFADIDNLREEPCR